MNTKELRVKIAAAMGYKLEPSAAHDGWVVIFNGKVIGSFWFDAGKTPTLEDAPALSLLPNFPVDLNACHEFEKTLEDTRLNDEWSRYCQELNRICCRIRCGGQNRLCGYTIHASAEQRCEAFDRIITLRATKNHSNNL